MLYCYSTSRWITTNYGYLFLTAQFQLVRNLSRKHCSACCICCRVIMELFTCKQILNSFLRLQFNYWKFVISSLFWHVARHILIVRYRRFGTTLFNMAKISCPETSVYKSMFCATFRKNILTYIHQDATLHSLFYLETALHVSGGTSTHHRELIQLYLQHLVFVTPLLLSVAIVEELEPVWVCCGWRTPI
jgi:hypothetical protein